MDTNTTETWKRICPGLYKRDHWQIQAWYEGGREGGRIDGWLLVDLRDGNPSDPLATLRRAKECAAILDGEAPATGAAHTAGKADGDEMEDDEEGCTCTDHGWWGEGHTSECPLSDESKEWDRRASCFADLVAALARIVESWDDVNGGVFDDYDSIEQARAALAAAKGGQS